MMNLVNAFFDIPRVYKRLITVFADVMFIVCASVGALFVRVGDDALRWFTPQSAGIVAVVVILSLLVWARLGLYRAVIRFLDVKALSAVLWGAAASALVLLVASFVLRAGLPRSVPFIYFALVLILVAGSRLFVRGLIQSRHGGNRIPVAIYGAGSAGRQLCLALQNGYEYEPAVFVDDSNELQGSSVQGVKVFAPEFLPELVKKHKVLKVLFAIPSVSLQRKQTIFNKVQALHVEMLTIPASAELIDGSISINEMRSVNIEDLLGRPKVEPNPALVDKCLRGKCVLVTGAGGSIGSELCRQIIQSSPRQLILLEQSEYNLYALERELKQHGHEIIPVLGSVLDEPLLESVLSSHQVHTIYHAAAYKHVPLVELNVQAGVKNNVWGTYYLARSAERHQVAHFILVSTDKAVRSTNVMGASKRLAELVVQGFAEASKSTVFSMVRFGNVLGSSGSVVPLFEAQIRAGGPVTVTHPDITRYFMTIPEAASLVIQAGAMAQGGDVFVLDMGQPVKIVDLAEKMIHLMGCQVYSEDQPNGDIAIEFSGLRPGEKLFEELLIGGEVSGTEHPRIMRANEECLSMAAVLAMLDELDAELATGNIQGVRAVMMAAPSGFQPSSDIVDWYWSTQQVVGEPSLRLIDSPPKTES